MRSGTLRDFITLLAPAPTNDTTWGPQPGWTTYAQVWANVTPTAGTETVTQQGVQTEVSHTVRIRYDAEVNNTYRIQYRDQVLEILSCIDPTGKRRELLIEAKQYTGVQ